MILQSRSDRALHDFVKEILLHEWDPIGVGTIPEAGDEYDKYVFDLCELIVHGHSAQQIFDYLRQLETEHIGLEGDETFTLAIAQKLYLAPTQIPE